MTDRATAWVALIRAAAADFDYPPPPVVSTVAEAEGYLRKLIAHVETRDLARGFELRVAAKQSAWTPEQVQAFADYMRRKPRRDPEKFSKPWTAFHVTRCTLAEPVTDALVRRFAEATLQHMVTLRVEAPDRELPLLVGGLTTTGEFLTTSVDRDDRIAFVTLLARTQPLYGWFVASDMFIHQIAVGAQAAASKQDAIGVHFGTRTARGFLVRPYRVVNAGTVDLLPERDMFTEGQDIEDPYAFIFQPTTTTRPQ